MKPVMCSRCRRTIGYAARLDEAVDMLTRHRADEHNLGPTGTRLTDDSETFRALEKVAAALALAFTVNPEAGLLLLLKLTAGIAAVTVADPRKGPNK